MAGNVIVLLVFIIGIVNAGAQDDANYPPSASMGRIDPEYFSIIDLNSKLATYIRKMEKVRQQLAYSISAMYTKYAGGDDYEPLYSYAKPDRRSPFPPRHVGVVPPQPPFVKEMPSHGDGDDYEYVYSYADPAKNSGYRPVLKAGRHPTPPPVNPPAQRRAYYGLSSSSSGKISNINDRVNKYEYATFADNGRTTTYKLEHS